jgi:hypothetical protein
MENCNVHIMYARQSLSLVPYTRGCVMKNLQFDLKHLVTMNSMFLGMIPPSTQSIINFRCVAPILSVKSYSCYVCKLSRKLGLVEFSVLGVCRIHRMQDKY